MAAILYPLLTNKFFLYFCGTVFGGLLLYIKGYLAAKSSIQKDQASSDLKSAESIQKTEAQNQTIDKQREQDAKTTDSAESIDALISMWNKLDKEAPRNPTDKN